MVQNSILEEWTKDALYRPFETDEKENYLPCQDQKDWEPVLTETETTHEVCREPFVLNALDGQGKLRSDFVSDNHFLKAAALWPHISHAAQESIAQIVQREEARKLGLTTVNELSVSNLINEDWNVGSAQVSRVDTDDKCMKSSGRKRKASPTDCFYSRAASGRVPDTIHMDDIYMVESYIYSLLEQVQQNNLKLIAKTWIKNICPSKRTTYRYDPKESKSRQSSGSNVPCFWPSIDRCRFIQPDHLLKPERTYLLFHLLRLRWTEAEWRALHGSEAETPDLVKSGSWVKFLRSLLTKELGEDFSLRPEVASRRTFLEEIFTCAQREEDLMQQGNIGYTQTYSPQIRELKLNHPKEGRFKTAKKRRRGVARTPRRKMPPGTSSGSASMSTPATWSESSVCGELLAEVCPTSPEDAEVAPAESQNLTPPAQAALMFDSFSIEAAQPIPGQPQLSPSSSFTTDSAGLSPSGLQLISELCQPGISPVHDSHFYQSIPLRDGSQQFSHAAHLLPTPYGDGYTAHPQMVAVNYAMLPQVDPVSYPNEFGPCFPPAGPVYATNGGPYTVEDLAAQYGSAGLGYYPSQSGQLAFGPTSCGVEGMMMRSASSGHGHPQAGPPVGAIQWAAPNIGHYPMVPAWT